MVTPRSMVIESIIIGSFVNQRQGNAVSYFLGSCIRWKLLACSLVDTEKAFKEKQVNEKGHLSIVKVKYVKPVIYS
jgi:hypothetical protein